MVSTRIIILLLVAILCGVLFYYAFGKIPVPYVCELFPSGKEDLVRYYACSMALCAKGCPDNENQDHVVNKICIELDCTTNECKRWCNSYCFATPTEWPPKSSDWNQEGKLCGKEYSMDLQIENKFSFKGRYCADSIPFVGCKGFSTEVQDIIARLEKTENFPKIYSFGGYGGNLYEIGRKSALGYTYPAGEEDIFMYPEAASSIFGCSATNYEVYGFDNCLYEGNLKLWSDYSKDGTFSKTDVIINSSISSPATFDIAINPLTRTIELDDTATFNVTVINHLGTESDFTFSISYCSYNGGNDNCDENNLGCNSGSGPSSCNENFNPKSIKVADGDPNPPTSTLTLKPKLVGVYEIMINAKPSAAYGSAGKEITLTVTNFDVLLSPPLKEVKVNNEETFIVDVINNLDRDADFTLSYNCVGGCSCTFEANKNPLFVRKNSQNTTNIKCKSSIVGTKTLTVTAGTSDVTPKTSNGVVLKVVKCFGDITLSFDSTVNSGDPVTLTAGGLNGCVGVPVWFSVNDLNTEIGSCTGSNGCSKSFTTNSPGPYTIWAKIDLLNDNYADPNETASATLTINQPTMAAKGCNMCNGQWCSYHHNTFCQHWSCGFGCSWGKCSNSCDPQVCKQDDKGNCADYSSVCCIPNDNVYSPGPPDVPCLSPDNDKTNGGAKKNNYILWRGGNLDNARNVLVQDDIGSGSDIPERQGYYATFTQDYCDPKGPWPWDPHIPDDGWCDGTKELSGFTGLSGARCVQADTGYVGTQWLCKLSDLLPLYSSWLYIKISDTSRPVYGIQIKAFITGFDPGTEPSSFGHGGLFLHNSTGWFEAGDFKIYKSDGEGRKVQILRPPTGQWAWNDIDAMLIVNRGSYKGRNSPPSWSDFEFKVDYVGLLTKGADIPYCTEGKENDSYRTVEDGKTCYWNLQCSTSGMGWTGKISKGIGPFVDNNGDILGYGCSCSSGTCGSGSCRNGNLCYTNVKCMNGGWSGDVVNCP